MKICLIANVPFHSVGGRLQRMVEILKKDHKICWINPPPSNTYDSKKINTNIDTTNIKILKTPPAKNVFHKTILKELYSYKHIKRNAEKIDICIIYDGWGSFFVRRFLKKRKIPVVFDYVDKMYHFISNPFMKFIHKKLIYDAFKTSDAVICTAHKLHEEAQKINKNSYYIPNGAPEIRKDPGKKIKKKSGKIIVGYLGAFGNWLNFEILEKSIKKLKNIEFYIIGGGERNDYVNLLDSENENVKRIKPIPYKEVPAWINSFDICIIPFEVNEITDAVSPLKLFEYWSLKKPVVCTPTYELKKMMGKKHIVLAKDQEEFYKSLKKLSENKKLRDKIGKESYKQFKKRYTFDILTAKFIRILKDEHKKKTNKKDSKK